MLDEKIIEEIVRRVVQRLKQDPRFLALLGAESATGEARRPRQLATRHYGRLLSEWDVLTVHRSGGRLIQIEKSVIVTPLARDRARDLGVEIITGQP